jgi:hypothetical protein
MSLNPNGWMIIDLIMPNSIQIITDDCPPAEKRLAPPGLPKGEVKHIFDYTVSRTASEILKAVRAVIAPGRELAGMTF